MNDYIPVLVLFGLLAVVLQQDFVLTLFYLLTGVYFVSSAWGRRALQAVRFKHTFSAKRAFLGEKIQVSLDLVNTGWLPVMWLYIRESLPVSMVTTPVLNRVVSLGPRGRHTLAYSLAATKRGYYRIGPIRLQSGDIFGVQGDQMQEGEPDWVTVYPKIVPLTNVGLPSRTPIGTLRHTQPIYEDPNRVVGKREYMAGDSLHRIDWKSTASLGRLQVRQFQPSISLETVIVLNLNADEYELPSRSDDTELAIVVAASMANWIAGQKQPIGLITNGIDPAATNHHVQYLPVRRGRGHLMRLLEMLARAQTARTIPMTEMLRRESPRLAWGTTLILVTRQVDAALFDGMFQARRAGLNAVLILCGLATDGGQAMRRARQFGFAAYRVESERDLITWRQSRWHTSPDLPSRT